MRCIGAFRRRTGWWRSRLDFGSENDAFPLDIFGQSGQSPGMIIARLHGRLGNQMFQYAAARGLAARLNVPVAIDPRQAIERGDGVLTRVFDLPLATAQSLPPPRRNALGYFAWRWSGLSPRFFREKGLGYNSRIEAVKSPAYLHGYWQSERYFAHIAEQLRKDFAFPPCSTVQNATMASQIASGPAIALHVRRGDYLAPGPFMVCDEAYYLAALEQISAGMADPVVYVFSDDPDWAKSGLPLPCQKVVIDFNGPEADFEDMRLMSLCQHNIISNSSFSWWAAWLNTSHEQRVAAPARWFSDPGMVNPDIVPDHWMRIPV